METEEPSPEPVPQFDDLIDDMEDGDESIIEELEEGEKTGRAGTWYSYGDEAGSFEHEGDSLLPVAVDLAAEGLTSEFAVNARGSGFSEYVGFAFSLNAPSETEINTYDLSGSAGFGFYAKRGGDEPSTLRVSFADDQTDPKGGICSEDDDECYANFGQDIALGTEWKRYTIWLDELAQPDWTESNQMFEEFHASKVFAVAFDLADPGVAAFDVWVDDVGLITERPD